MIKMSCETKEFKTETKKLLDMMIHSIYTHKEIFLRELISNASDAIDKRKFLSLTDQSIINPDYQILVEADKTNRTLTISDNGIGMNKEELENNLGTIELIHLILLVNLGLVFIVPLWLLAK